MPRPRSRPPGPPMLALGVILALPSLAHAMPAFVADDPGGVYARARGDTLVPNEQCAMRPRLTMRSSEPLSPGTLAALADAVEASTTAITKVARVPPPFVVVEVDGEAPALTLTRAGAHVLVPLAVPPRATTDASRDALARAIAALSFVASVVPHERPGAAAALVRTVWPGAPIAPALGAPAYEIAPWTRAVDRCPRGWSGLLDGTCETPDAR